MPVYYLSYHLFVKCFVLHIIMQRIQCNIIFLYIQIIRPFWHSDHHLQSQRWQIRGVLLFFFHYLSLRSYKIIYGLDVWAMRIVLQNKCIYFFGPRMLFFIWHIMRTTPGLKYLHGGQLRSLPEMVEWL